MSLIRIHPQALEHLIGARYPPDVRFLEMLFQAKSFLRDFIVKHQHVKVRECDYLFVCGCGGVYMSSFFMCVLKQVCMRARELHETVFFGLFFLSTFLFIRLTHIAAYFSSDI